MRKERVFSQKHYLGQKRKVSQLLKIWIREVRTIEWITYCIVAAAQKEKEQQEQQEQQQQQQQNPSSPLFTVDR